MSDWLMLVELYITPLTWSEIGTAILCGTVLGFERQILGKPAGIRTSILICLGTYLFVKLGISVHEEDMTATARVIGQVITGIGFLGAGVILNREGIVHGVTSAAVIWMLSAIGATIGMGLCIPAIIICFLTILVLTGVDFLESSFLPFRKGVHKKLRRKPDSPSSSS